MIIHHDELLKKILSQLETLDASADILSSELIAKSEEIKNLTAENDLLKKQVENAINILDSYKLELEQIRIKYATSINNNK